MSSTEDFPSTVREAIRKGLAENWTRELEEALFWPIADFLGRSYSKAYAKGKEDTLNHLREAGVLQ